MTSAPTPHSLRVPAAGMHGLLTRSAPWLAVAAAIVLQCVVWNDSLFSLVATWFRSGTFSHCPLIVAISAVLVWHRRHTLQTLQPAPSAIGLAMVVAVNAVWLIGSAADVLSLQQFSVVAVIPVLVLAVLGRQIAGALAFPLCYLLFAVPVGESLVPPLMNFTAEFTIGALRLVGIPVFQDGFYFSTSAGDFEVAKACSGVRYLIASVALGALFSHLMFRTWKRRLWFTVATILIPLLANGVRAFLIVSIAHLSNMKLAVGIDHVIYGWIFFGFVMLLLFVVGLRFREPAPEPPVSNADVAPPSVSEAGAPWRCLVAAAACTALGVVSAAWSENLHAPQPQTRTANLELASSLGPWVRQPRASDEWLPRFKTASVSTLASYAQGDVRIEIFVALYPDQRQGLEMINSDNSVFDKPRWRRVAEDSIASGSGDASAPRDVHVSYLRSGSVERTVWQWYLLGDLQSSNEPLLKARLAWERLRGERPAAAAIAIATTSGGDDAHNDAILREFFATAGADLKNSLSAVTAP